MSAANRLLCSQFPSQHRMVHVLLKQNRSGYTSNCLSDKFSSPGSVDLFDSMHTVPVEDGTIVSQVCSILKTPKPTITTNVVNVKCLFSNRW